jgi:phage tail-like protein
MAYPLPVFHFSVNWGGTLLSFSEVTGLNVEVQPIEYRDGTNRDYAVTKMPGLKKYGNLTLKRGVFAGDNEYYDWINEIALNKITRRDVIISLLNEAHEPVMTWKVINAWPTKLTSPDLKANANEAAIESIEVAHEGIQIENA